MEFCQLGDLSYFIKKRDQLASHSATAAMMRKYPAQAGAGLHEVIVRHFLKQLASALEFLRARNFIHRDVKPQNLLLNPSPLDMAQSQGDLPYTASEDSLVPVVGVQSLPMLKIADFGFARSLPSTSLAETLCGSPLYMAPEILRYEKYDAKADLWSVGTVLYEMVVGRPPFRASNHVELLRRIERGDDRITFPDGLAIRDDLQSLIRRLLKRNPVERITFDEFFHHSVVRDEIPGLVGEDRRPREEFSSPRAPSADRHQAAVTTNHDAQAMTTMTMDRGPSSDGRRAPPPNLAGDPGGRAGTAPPNQPVLARPRSDRSQPAAAAAAAAGGVPPTAPLRTASQRRPSDEGRSGSSRPASRDQPRPPRRPAMTSHATAPARPDLHHRRAPAVAVAAATEMERRSGPTSSEPDSSLVIRPQREAEPRSPARIDERSSRDARERAEQEIAFERDYVLVEKRAVEVNAFADELAASPQIHGGGGGGGGGHVTATAPQAPGVMARRATTHGNVPTSSSSSPSSGPASSPSGRAIQVVTSKTRPDQHHRRSSYERRYGVSPGSTTSAISKALNMANHRLFGAGFSPPFFGYGGGGSSPPPAYTAAAFPAYPITQGSLVMVGGDASKANVVPADEDARAVQTIEEAATRSDVVYGFAEVKYKQLIPLAPSIGIAGIAQDGVAPDDGPSTTTETEEGLTVDAILTLSEEALVLYVKALALLAKSMDIAGAWWARKNRGEASLPLRSDHQSQAAAAAATTSGNILAGNRINGVVQWVRARFNEVLEKAEFVTLKLVEAQKQLPASHPSHPSHHPTTTSALSASGSTRMGTSAETVVVGSGVTAEKLIYERALEISRAAAVNELVGEDLSGCEIAYVTAVRMLEAVLETDEEGNLVRTGDGYDVNGMQMDDRQVVEKRTSNLSLLRTFRVPESVTPG